MPVKIGDILKSRPEWCHCDNDSCYDCTCGKYIVTGIYKFPSAKISVVTCIKINGDRDIDDEFWENEEGIFFDKIG
jgi:hypothetical protein